MPSTLRFTLLALGCVLALSSAQAGDEAGFAPLFNGKDLTGWKTFFADKNADPAKTFVVKDGVLQVSGFPNGYFYTDKSYQNYVLRYSWTYPKDQPAKTTMNSGCLVHIHPPHKLWPHCVEPQGRYRDQGKLFFTGFPKGVKNEATFDEAAMLKARRPADEWNTSEVTARADGTLEVRLNGTLVSTGKSTLTEGPIGFQCEGARIDYKDIKLKQLP